MSTLSNININDLTPILEKFSKDKFNDLSYDDKIKLIEKLAIRICEQFPNITPLSPNNFTFLSYDKFLSKKHEIKVVKFDISSRLIPVKEIEEGCPFNTLEHNLKIKQNVMTKSSVMDTYTLDDLNNIR